MAPRGPSDPATLPALVLMSQWPETPRRLCTAGNIHGADPDRGAARRAAATLPGSAGRRRPGAGPTLAPLASLARAAHKRRAERKPAAAKCRA